MIPQINVQETGKNIVLLMNKKGVAVKDVQNACGFYTPQAVYKWRNGVCLPTIDNLVILADLLGVTVDEILVVGKGE